MLRALQLWSPCLRSSQETYIEFLKKKQTNNNAPYHPGFAGWPHVLRLANFLRFFRICQLPNHPRFRQRRPYVVRFANYFRFPEYVNHRTAHVFLSGPYQIQLADCFCFPEFKQYQQPPANQLFRCYSCTTSLTYQNIQIKLCQSTISYHNQK